MKIENNKASYLGAHAGLSLAVLLVGHPLVQLTPQSFRLPGGDPLFQTVVESAAVGRVQVQLSAEDVEGLEGFLAGRRLDKVLKKFPHIVPLLLRLSHLLLLRRAVWTHWGSLSVRCGYTLGLVGNAMPSLSWEGWLRRKEGWGGVQESDVISQLADCIPYTEWIRKVKSNNYMVCSAESCEQHFPI